MSACALHNRPTRITGPFSHFVHADDGSACRTADPTLGGVPLSDDQARELSRAAANVRTWTEKRNTLIRAAHAAGGGIREIAKATGLNVGTVHTMIHGRKR